MASGLLLLALAGCVHTIPVRSFPDGATVSVGGAAPTRVPTEVAVRPFGPKVIVVSLPGYRSATVHLSRTGPLSFVWDAVTFRFGRMVGLTPYREVEIRLLREHGGMGTWDPQDLQ